MQEYENCSCTIPLFCFNFNFYRRFLTFELQTCPLHLARLLFFLVTTCFAYASMAQSQQHYLFSNITSRNGLASNNVNSLAQDDEGYLWIATVNGLQRYDGSRFTSFYHNPADSNSIPNNHIRLVYFDKHKNLWLNFDNGKMGRFDTHKFVFTETRIIVPDENILLADRSIKEDAAGNLFMFFSYYLLTTYNAGTNEFSAAHNTFATPTGWKITGMHCDQATNKYWIAFDSGLCIYNTRNKHLNYRHHNPDKELAIEHCDDKRGMYGLLIDSKQRLWFCTWPVSGSKVHSYDIGKQQYLLNNFSLDSAFNYYHEPRAFIQHRNGTIWLYGTGMLGQFDEKANLFVNTGNEAALKATIPKNRIDCL